MGGGKKHQEQGDLEVAHEEVMGHRERDERRKEKRQWKERYGAELRMLTRLGVGKQGAKRALQEANGDVAVALERAAAELTPQPVAHNEAGVAVDQPNKKPKRLRFQPDASTVVEDEKQDAQDKLQAKLERKRVKAAAKEAKQKLKDERRSQRLEQQELLQDQARARRNAERMQRLQQKAADTACPPEFLPLLQQLSDAGHHNVAANVRLLHKTKGSVKAALDRLEKKQLMAMVRDKYCEQLSELKAKGVGGGRNWRNLRLLYELKGDVFQVERVLEAEDAAAQQPVHHTSSSSSSAFNSSSEDEKQAVVAAATTSDMSDVEEMELVYKSDKERKKADKERRKRLIKEAAKLARKQAKADAASVLGAAVQPATAAAPEPQVVSSEDDSKEADMERWSAVEKARKKLAAKQLKTELRSKHKEEKRLRKLQKKESEVVRQDAKHVDAGAPHVEAVVEQQDVVDPAPFSHVMIDGSNVMWVTANLREAAIKSRAKAEMMLAAQVRFALPVAPTLQTVVLLFDAAHRDVLCTVTDQPRAGASVAGSHSGSAALDVSGMGAVTSYTSFSFMVRSARPAAASADDVLVSWAQMIAAHSVPADSPTHRLSGASGSGDFSGSSQLGEDTTSEDDDDDHKVAVPQQQRATEFETESVRLPTQLSRALFVTSNRELTARLQAMGAQVMKPRHFVAFMTRVKQQQQPRK